MQRSFRQHGQNAKEAEHFINCAKAIASHNANAVPNSFFRLDQNQFVPFTSQPNLFRGQVGQNCQDEVILLH